MVYNPYIMMGLHDIVKKRREFGGESMPRGEQVLTETKEEFLNFCKSLTKEFKGVMRLYGKINGKLYTAGLLLENGNVIAASFEDIDNETIIFGEEAILQIKERLSGTKGDLEVYAFSDKDMEKVKEGNREALLTHTMPFSYLGLKIRLKMEEWAKKTSPESFVRGEKPEIEELKTEEGFNLVDFARKFPEIFSSKKEEKIQLRREEIPEEKKPLVEFDDIKMERLTELKRRGQMEDLALRRRISKIGKKKPGEKIEDVGKVETSIDKLYKLVQKYKKLKIDNKLSRRLGVSRSQIESWAMILEEHDLVELHYSAIGEPEIRKVKGKV